MLNAYVFLLFESLECAALCPKMRFSMRLSTVQALLLRVWWTNAGSCASKFVGKVSWRKIHSSVVWYCVMLDRNFRMYACVCPTVMLLVEESDWVGSADECLCTEDLSYSLVYVKP